MSTVCGLLGLVFAAAMIWLGFSGAPVWTPLAGALVGAVLYFGVKPAAVTVLHRSGVFSSFLPMVYIAQVVMSGLFYGIGVGAAALIG